MADEVYDAVVTLLLDGNMLPGEKANIELIARDLNVSPTPVREALVRLEAEGLVTKRALRGYTVAPPLDAKGFEDLFLLRRLLESEAARLASDRLSVNEFATLDTVLTQMRDIAAQERTGDGFAAFKEFVFHDAEFHQAIAAASGNDLLANVITGLRPQLHLYRLYFQWEVMASTNHEHEAILAALRSGDAEGARQAMVEHIDNSHERIAAHL